jgi:hypothetical protein
VPDPKRLLICTPLDGDPRTATVHWTYHNAVRQLERAGAVVMPAELLFAYDVSRARSVAAWRALQRPDWDWVLWFDEDVVVSDTSIVPRMIERAEEDDRIHILGKPYPRKRLPLEYPVRPLPGHMATGAIQIDRDVAEVEAVPFGFTLTSRGCLQEMSECYQDELRCKTDKGETVPMLFALTFADTARGREYLSEDNSFCHRWRALGGKVHAYFGGDPLGHTGAYTFAPPAVQ